MRLAIICLALTACGHFEKKHEVKDPLPGTGPSKDQHAIYVDGVQAELDGRGLVLMAGDLDDSALFSCLAYAAQAVDFDVSLFFDHGKPLRHPDVSPDNAASPTSKDMQQGLLWCLYAMPDRAEALAIITEWIDYGLAHQTPVGWVFCTPEETAAYGISPANYLGMCVATPALIHDIYLLAKHLGYDCGFACQAWMLAGSRDLEKELQALLSISPLGYEKHLMVISTLRNGLIHGGVSDISLMFLKMAADSNPDNALYQASYHTFHDGDQSTAMSALQNIAYFPLERLPTDEEYCEYYLFQRDPTKVDGFGQRYPNPDWFGCLGHAGASGRGVDWLFARAVALGF